jgi:hypothetical protein
MKLNTGSLLSIFSLAAAVGRIDGQQLPPGKEAIGDVVHRRDQTTNTTTTCTHHFYTTDISMDSDDSLSCTDKELKTIGIELDSAYDEIVDVDGALSALELDTSVCSVPNSRRNLQGAGGEVAMQRELQAKLKFNWSGGGKCKLCTDDNGDRRMIAEDHAGADNEQGDHPIQHERELREAYSVIDFNTDGDGQRFPYTLNYVKNQWHAKYGLQITVEGNNGAQSYSQAIAYSSTNLPRNSPRYLGTPNQRCPGGGPGRGLAGIPGAVGENCIAQGNILLIENPAESIVLTFASPTRVGHLALMNVYFGKRSLEIVTAKGKTVSIDFDGLGDNGVQEVHVDMVVKRIKILMGYMGTVTEIGIFTPTTAIQALSPEARSFIQNKDPLAEYIPYLEFDLSYYLTRRINDIFGRMPSSCLYNKWVNIDVQMESVSKLPTKMC